MARIYLKKVNTLKQNCGGCYFFIKNPMHCEAQKNKQVDCFNDNIHCINSNIIFKQIHFERVEDLCRNCYFYLSKTPYCFFPEDKNRSDCANNNLIYKEIIKADEL